MPNQSCRRRGDLPRRTPSETESMESLRGRINLAGLEPADLEANRNAPRSLRSSGVFEEAWGGVEERPGSGMFVPRLI